MEVGKFYNVNGNEVQFIYYGEMSFEEFSSNQNIDVSGVSSVYESDNEESEQTATEYLAILPEVNEKVFVYDFAKLGVNNKYIHLFILSENKLEVSIFENVLTEILKDILEMVN